MQPRSLDRPRLDDAAGQVVVGGFDEIGHQIGCVLEAVVMKPVAQPGERAREQDDNQVAEIRLGDEAVLADARDARGRSVAAARCVG